MAKLFFRNWCSSAITDSLKPLIAKSSSIKGIVRLPSNDLQQDTAEVSRTAPPSNTLVILVGWAMSRQKHVGKYSPVYNNLGLSTLSLTPTLFHTWDLLSYDKYTRNVMETVDSSFRGDVYLHLFSGAASIILPYITQNIDKLRNVDLKGIVFDCSPSIFGIASGKAAAKMALEHGGMNRLTYYLSVNVGITVDTFKGRKVRQETNEALASPALQNIPQLYLYSDTDTVVPMDRVQSVMEGQKQLGREVEGVMFHGVDHVRLLQSEPDKYRGAIRSFISKRIST